MKHSYRALIIVTGVMIGVAAVLGTAPCPVYVAVGAAYGALAYRMWSP
jgi:hypothetical protein